LSDNPSMLKTFVSQMLYSTNLYAPDNHYLGSMKESDDV
jgi:hypothetical protein